MMASLDRIENGKLELRGAAAQRGRMMSVAAARGWQGRVKMTGQQKKRAGLLHRLAAACLLAQAPLMTELQAGGRCWAAGRHACRCARAPPRIAPLVQTVVWAQHCSGLLRTETWSLKLKGRCLRNVSASVAGGECR